MPSNLREKFFSICVALSMGSLLLQSAPLWAQDDADALQDIPVDSATETVPDTKASADSVVPPAESGATQMPAANSTPPSNSSASANGKAQTETLANGMQIVRPVQRPSVVPPAVPVEPRVADADSEDLPPDEGSTLKIEPMPGTSTATSSSNETPPAASADTSFTDPSAADPALSDDVRALEQRFQQEVGEVGQASAGPNATPEQQLEKDLEQIDPLELFSRVPLRPRISSAGWSKWAGPMLTKIYRVQKNDSLWAISQRFFGTPFLWPKVWQLNAMFRNPHVIEPKQEMQFRPGNPNSAPSLAFVQNYGEEQEEMPLLTTRRTLTEMEMLDYTFYQQNHGEEPPFRFFLVKTVPKVLARMPTMSVSQRKMYTENDEFEYTKLPEGSYSIVRILSLGMLDSETKGHRMQWLGNLDVAKGRAKISRGFSDIQTGDLLIQQDFRLSPLALYDENYDLDRDKWGKFAALQEGGSSMVAAHQMIGLNFPAADRGPRPGALLNFRRNGNEYATLLLLHRSGELGTAWVMKSNEEVFIDINF